MEIRRRLWCYAVLTDPSSWFIPLILLWAGTALGLESVGRRSFVPPFYPPMTYLTLICFLTAINILEKSLRQIFRGATLAKRFMGSVSIFEATLLSLLVIYLGFKTTGFHRDYFTLFTFFVFVSLVLLYLPPFSLKNRGIISNIFQAFSFGFLIPVWAASIINPFPYIANVFIGAIFFNYLFGIYLMRDYVRGLRSTQTGVKREMFSDFKNWEFVLIVFCICLPFLFLPLGIHFQIIRGNIYYFAGLSISLFLYGSTILVYLMRKEVIGRSEIAKIQFHLDVILIIAILFLVKF